MSPPPPQARFRSCFCRPGSNMVLLSFISEWPQVGLGVSLLCGRGDCFPLSPVGVRTATSTAVFCFQSFLAQCVQVSTLSCPASSPLAISHGHGLCVRRGTCSSQSTPPMDRFTCIPIQRDTEPGPALVPDLAFVAFTAQASCKQGLELKLEGLLYPGLCHLWVPFQSVPRVRSPQSEPPCPSLRTRPERALLGHKD